jgi:hypothetical protein
MRRRRNIRFVTAIFMAIALALFLPCLCIAGDLEPSGAPAPTMKTLDQIPPAWSIKLPASERFVVLADFNNEAVLDKETGLVWEKSPSTTTYTWENAIYHCGDLNVGGRKGWHLPTLEQLASLVDTSVSVSPKLPTGHPFTAVQSFTYWSATTSASNTTYAWHVYFGYGSVGYYDKPTNSYAWCVRGGQSYDAY